MLLVLTQPWRVRPLLYTSQLRPITNYSPWLSHVPILPDHDLLAQIRLLLFHRSYHAGQSTYPRSINSPLTRSIQLLILVLQTNSAEFGITVAAIPVVLVLLVGAGFAVQREIKWYVCAVFEISLFMNCHCRLMSISLVLMLASETYCRFSISLVHVRYWRDSLFLVSECDSPSLWQRSD